MAKIIFILCTAKVCWLLKLEFTVCWLHYCIRKILLYVSNLIMRRTESGRCKSTKLWIGHSPIMWEIQFMKLELRLSLNTTLRRIIRMMKKTNNYEICKVETIRRNQTLITSLKFEKIKAMPEPEIRIRTCYSITNCHK